MSEISSKIPFPGKAKPAGRPAKYPWREMAVGDSFAVHIHTLSNVRACAKGYGERHGKQFEVARIPETGEYRCWRLA